MKQLLFFSSALMISTSSFAQPGTLDGDFDADGILFIDPFNNTDLAQDVAQTADGKLVVAGYTFNNGDNDWMVKRLHPDGSADNSFGIAGLVVLDLAAGADLCRAMELQDDGKILLAGTTEDNTSSDLTVMRLETNGNMDATFGTNGMAVVDVANGSYDLLYDMAFNLTER